MNVKLVVERGARRRTMLLTPPEAIVGRAHGNTVRIPSAEVSRQHCRLRLKDGLVTVEDMGSVNGTFLNGRRVTDAEYVRPGDQLEVGPVKFVVEYELTPTAAQRLRSNDTAGLLELLADGDEVDELAQVEELPVLEEDDLQVLEALENLPAMELDEDDLPSVEPVGDDLPALPVTDKPLPLFEATEEEEPAKPKSDDAMIPADFDFDGAPWQMPAQGDLRDLLEQMEEDVPTDNHDAKKPKKGR
jgi:pSer/pThr/pTyr-binding forkhead associated (FHA) protein